MWIGAPFLLLASCQAPSPEDTSTPACRALAEAARRGARCDPQLASLAEQVEQEGSEPSCRRAARHLLDPEPYDGQIRSIYAAPNRDEEGPLADDELQALSRLPLPGRVRLQLRGSPSSAPASVRLDGERLALAPEGFYDVRTSPGPHRLELLALGERGVHCIIVPTCDELVLEVRGVSLADEEARPFVSDAACGLDPALELSSAD